MKSEMHVSIFILFIITALIFHAIAPNVYSEPLRLLGDNGSYTWSSAGLLLHGVFPLNDGDRVMQTFSARRATDGHRHIYLQIVDEDVIPVYDPPLQLSDEDLISSLGGAIMDSDGNIFVTWVSADPGDAAVTSLYAQKFNSEGEPQWGENPVLVGFLNEEPLEGYPPRILPDEHGGFFYLTSRRFVAVDQDGNFREGWQWADRRPDPQYGMVIYVGGSWKMTADELGGFWYEMIDGGDRIWNHVDYQGEKLWEVPRTFEGEGLPELEDRVYARILAGLNGGCICRYVYASSYLFVIGADGELLGRDYVHFLEDQNQSDMHLWDCNLHLLEGSFVLSWTYSADQNYAGITLYNPDRNRFPWGMGGVTLQDRERGISTGRAYIMMETSRGDIISAVSRCDDSQYYEVFLVSIEGRLIWDDPVRIEHLSPKYLTSTNDNGFWMLGFTSGVVGDTYLVRLNRFNEEGEPLLEEFTDIGIPERFNLIGPYLWTDLEGNYRLIFSQPEIGIKVQTMNSRGEIVGDQAGQLILPFNEKSGQRKGIKVGDKTIYMLWWRNSQDNYRHNILNLWGFNLDAELQWTTTERDSSWGSRVYASDIIAAPDSQHALIAIDIRDADTGARKHLLFWLDVEDGRLLWQRELPNSGYRNDQAAQKRILIDRDTFYYVFENQEDTLIAYKFDLNGNTLWQEPYREFIDEPEFFGASLRSDGGLWLAKYSETEDGLEVWVEALEEDGQEIVARWFFYAEPWAGDYDSYSDAPFKLVSDHGNLWVLSYGNIDYGIQCLSEDGQHLLGDHGFLPESIGDDRDDDDFWGHPDGEGGLWLTWIRNGTGVLHFNSEGKLYEGWSEEGYMLWGEGLVSKLKVHNVLPNTDLMIVADKYSSDGPFGDLIPGGRSYYLQHLREGAQSIVNVDEPSQPIEFRINRVFPQPFNDRVQIDYELNQRAEVIITLFDLSGRLHYSQSFISKPGSNTVNINAHNWSSGVYIARIETGGAFRTSKLVLVR